ncbi:phosphoribosyltransferase family protein [Gracilimonas amylolytica]|uniref:phosphoribosyltransferase family protein n=1 Tax=Gracilimonas amylolytica TaxID=1749045 RepID=UPI001E563F95|nr:phosphoribosyltransferase family protein [Gracilimonas amylolytica]
MSKQFTLMDRARIVRTLKRLAIQILEKSSTGEDLVIIGLNERGLTTAKEIAADISAIIEENVTVHNYNIADNNPGSTLPDCSDKQVILVDDVIFSGKTMFEALSAVASIHDPKSIRIAVLIDRGHRKYPLSADLTGMTVPTKPGEHIEVMLKDSKLKEAVLFKN